MDNFQILYEDKTLLVCVKPVGILSEEAGMPQLIARYLQPDAPPDALPYVGVIHRLDRDVGGVMVYAKTKEAAAALSAMAADGRMEKEYLAVVLGTPPEHGEMTDLLYHDRTRSKTFVVDRKRRGVKEASLEYRVLATGETETGVHSLVRIRLHTGRTHQIRVQFASRHWPLVGDPRYGGSRGKPALFSCSLRFCHPEDARELRFQAFPALDGAWADFKENIGP